MGKLRPCYIQNIAGITRVFLIVFFACRDHTLGGVAAVQAVRRRSDATEKYRAALLILLVPAWSIASV